MRRRLDLAASLVAQPRVLFLDEPTTGLDPRSRVDLWEVIRDLVAEGITLLLTTQYLEEADRLADEIAVIDHGLVIASGTPEELKDRIGGDVLEFRVPDGGQAARAVEAVAPLSSAQADTDQASGVVALPVGKAGSQVLVEAVRLLDRAEIEVEDLALRRPSLDNVFLSLTGHAAEEDQEAAAPSRGRRRRKRDRDLTASSGQH
jgi:ABC-2 type transport system ATP-binding protein